MVDKQQFFLPCFVVCAIFSAIVTAQQQPIQVDTDPSQIVVTENQRNVSLLCRVGRPIMFCTFKLPNYPSQVALSPDEPSRDGLRYYGSGLKAGQCGVTIDRITSAHDGPTTCSLFVDGRSAEGTIDVVVAVPPSQPTIDIGEKTNKFTDGSELTAYCIATGGNPAPELAWYLDDDRIYDGVGKPEQFDENNNRGVALPLKRFIRGSDNGRNLICQATHVAYPEGVSRTSFQIAVNYPPQALPEQTFHGLALGRHVDVTLQVHSNPAPQTHWNVDGFDIVQGTQLDRYSAAIPDQVAPGVYNVTLTIASLTLEDLSKRFTLHASNDLGSQVYTVLLSSQDAEVDESGGVGIGGIIGIVLAALIVLAAIALIVVARATGRWCFRGASLNTDLGPDSEAQIAHEDDLHDEKLQQQNPAAHYGEGEEKAAAAAQQPAEKDSKDGGGAPVAAPVKNGKHENGKQHQQKKQENGKSDKTNTPV